MKIFFCILFFLFSSSLRSQVITTVAGNGSASYSGDGGAATSAAIGYMADITLDNYGNYYFAENNNTIRKVLVSGAINTIAGTGTAGFSGDGGNATSAKLNYPGYLASDRLGNIYISDNNNSRIRKIDFATGIITTVVGTGTSGYSGDGGAATIAKINHPQGICFDYIGNLYIVDHNNYRIRKIDTLGIIATIAGNGTVGYGGDGGPATNANINCNAGICSDRFGNLYFCDASRIRKIDITTGRIQTISGQGSHSYGGDGGMATSAYLSGPIDLAFNNNGELFVSDNGNNRVRKIDTFNIITTIAGSGGVGFTGDGGLATTATIYSPRGIAFDNCGNLFISDNGNCRIRKVTIPYAHTPAVFTITSNTGDTICTGMPVTYTAHTTASGTLAYQWQVNGANAGSGAASYTYSPANGDNVKCVLIHTTPCYSDTIESNVLHMVTNVLGVTLGGATTVPIGSTVTVNATVTGADSAYNIQWRNKGVLFSTTTVPVVTYTKVMAVDSLTAKIVSASQGCNDSAVSGVWVVVGNVGVTSPQPSPKEREVLLWPNPVGDALFIEVAAEVSNAGYEVVVTNLVGQAIFKQSYFGTAKVGMGGFVKGVYFVQVNGTDGFRDVQRVVKE